MPNSLFADILKHDLDLRLKVTGRSMYPFIMNGETVILRKTPARSLQCGDIIYYVNSIGMPVLHRITEKKKLQNGEFSFITKGDALLHKDLPISQKQILAKALYIDKVLPLLGTLTIKLDSNVCRYLYTLFSIYRGLRQKVFNRTMLRKLFLTRIG
jgi:signal peptidase I